MNEGKNSIDQKPDYLVCICWEVMYSDIIQAIDAGSDSFEALQEKLMVGTGCSSCGPEVDEIVRDRLSKMKSC